MPPLRPSPFRASLHWPLLHVSLLHVPLLRWPRRLANRLALVSGLQLLLVAGSLAALSFNLGRRSGLESSEAYRQDASLVELSTHLSRKLNDPIWINALNLQWLRNQPGRRDDVQAMAERFWNQMQVFPVHYINFGGVDGAFVGLERTASGELRLNEDTPRSGRGTMAVYAMQPDGQRGRLLERIPGMTATHQEAWYVDTVRAGKATWSSIYAWEDQPQVFSISHNAPLYGPQQRLLGVVGVDMVLSQLSQWLQREWQDRRGLALIVEPNGDLVASSIPAYTLRRQGGSVRRSNLQELQAPLVRALTSEYFQRQPRGPLQLRSGSLAPQARPQRLDIAGQPYTLSAFPWGREEGLNWVLLAALPSEPSTIATERVTLLALLVSSAALALAVLLASRQIRALLRPLRQLERASQRLNQALPVSDLAGGDLDGGRLDAGRLDAGRLDAGWLDGGSADLHFASGISATAGEELTSLDGAIRDLVERYNSLTTSLRRAREREHQRDVQTLALLKDKLHSSLQAAAVAHEINQPLSVLLLNSQLLLQGDRGEQGQQLPESLRQRLESICSEAHRIVLTIEKMRALLRNVQTEHQRLDLREVAQSALLYVRSSGTCTGLPIDSRALDGAGPPAWIAGDAAQIQIAIVNLLRNAAEALIEANGDSPWLAIALRPHPKLSGPDPASPDQRIPDQSSPDQSSPDRRSPDQSGPEPPCLGPPCPESPCLELPPLREWWLEIADNGPGLPPAALEAPPLHTTKASGSGLGLFVVRTTMENHHGSLEIDTSPRGGALLRLRFPAWPPGPATPSSGASGSGLPSTGD